MKYISFAASACVSLMPFSAVAQSSRGADLAGMMGPAAKQYHRCISSASKRLDNSLDRAELVYEAAVKSCGIDGAVLNAIASKYYEEAESTTPMQAATRATQAVKQVENDWKTEVVLQILEQRAANK